MKRTNAALGVLSAVVLGIVLGAAPGVAQQDAKELTKSQEHYRRGVELMNNSRYLDAVEAFQLSMDEDETNLESYRRLAFVFTKMAETDADYYQDALDVYDDLQTQLPEADIDVMKNVAYVQAAMGDMDDAVATYEDILVIKPDDCDIYLQIGAAEKLQADRLGAQEGAEAEQKAKLDKAVASYTKVTELCPDTLEPYTTLGDIYFNDGRTEEAAKLFTALLEKDPENVATAGKLAYIYKQGKMWDKAAPVYEKILAVDAENVNARQNYAQALQKMKKFSESAVQFNMLIDRGDENSKSLYCNLVFVYIDAGDYEQAINTALRGISENAPQQGCLYYGWGKGLEMRGQDMVRKGQYDRAITTYREAKLKFGEGLKDANFKGHSQKQLERLDKLIEIANQTKDKAKQQGK